MTNRQVAPVLEPHVPCLLQEFRVARGRLVLLLADATCSAASMPKQRGRTVLPPVPPATFGLIGGNQGRKRARGVFVKIWVKRFDNAQNATFYCNVKTGQSQWIPPGIYSTLFPWMNHKIW